MLRPLPPAAERRRLADLSPSPPFERSAEAHGAFAVRVDRPADLPADVKPELRRVQPVAPTSTDERLRLAAETTYGWLDPASRSWPRRQARAELLPTLAPLAERARALHPRPRSASGLRDLDAGARARAAELVGGSSLARAPSRPPSGCSARALGRLAPRCARRRPAQLSRPARTASALRGSPPPQERLRSAARSELAHLRRAGSRACTPQPPKFSETATTSSFVARDERQVDGVDQPMLPRKR